ncbi:probable 3-hydroxybutyryl-CoA dehydratase (plasmid) [Rhodococcus jostii RHA1]|uniref:Probable enoyl-CoA hydratase EchA17 n=1 Tax=Rhodococcus jostii (strain RHA1) TaxID=101510 RepID=Q0RVK4_RHOJR|nr:enoyl-CoA hydratase/isomerase family protein [Rhodococcus jostii]ABH00682.1 probable 3-hydroxybutyryl-CoA dehydratase [Rhodococcus jostii RHA1]
MPSPSSVVPELQDDITTIVLSGQAGRLPLSPAGLPDLTAALTAAEQNPHIRCVVFTGTENTFATGADLNEIARNDADANARYNRALIEAINRIDLLPVPTIAAINGHALGGGLELALACDLRIAADTAMLGLPETRLGLIPGAGGTQRLPRLIGEARAMDLLLTGRTVNASEALHLGLVNEVAPHDRLASRTQRLAATIARNAPLALRVAKAEVRAGRTLHLFDAIDATHDALAPLLTSEDLREGLAAFRARRQARFIGR